MQAARVFFYGCILGGLPSPCSAKPACPSSINYLLSLLYDDA